MVKNIPDKSKIVNFPLPPSFIVERSHVFKSFSIGTGGGGKGFLAFFIVVRTFFIVILDAQSSGCGENLCATIPLYFDT